MMAKPAKQILRSEAPSAKLKYVLFCPHLRSRKSTLKSSLKASYCVICQVYIQHGGTLTAAFPLHISKTEADPCCFRGLLFCLLFWSWVIVVLDKELCNNIGAIVITVGEFYADTHMCKVGS